jgi:hypothetical protein
MLDGDALGLTKQRDIARVVHDPMQPVELWLCHTYHAFDGLLPEAQRALGKDARRLAAFTFQLKYSR